MSPAAATGNTAVPEATGPSQSPWRGWLRRLTRRDGLRRLTRRGWLRRLTRRGWVVGGAVLTVLVVTLGHVPRFYRGCRQGSDADGRRLISKVATLGSAIGRPGRWGSALTEEEINGWLRTDLPRNHAGLLPAGVTHPRMALANDVVRVGARFGWGPVATVASADLRLDPLDAGRLRADVLAVRLGALPLPSGPVVHALGRWLTAVGLPNELRRLDGRTAIVVYISGAGEAAGKVHRLDALDVRDGELLFAGETLPAPESQRR